MSADTISTVAICLVVAVAIASCSFAGAGTEKARYAYKEKCLEAGGTIGWDGNCTVPAKEAKP